MGVKPIVLDEKLSMGVLLVQMIEKCKETNKKLGFLQFLSKIGEFSSMLWFT